MHVHDIDIHTSGTRMYRCIRTHREKTRACANARETEMMRLGGGGGGGKARERESERA